MQQKHREGALDFGEEQHGVRGRYRRLLYHHARLRLDHAGNVARKGIAAAQSDQVVRDELGKLGSDSLLMHTVRHFSRGLAVGSKDWLEGMFQANRVHFGPKRKTGARRVKVGGGLHSLRQL
jgi:hypothetical protein